MLKSDRVMRMYEDLAYLYDRKGQAKLRDCYLMLAADAAFTAGWEDVAERIRIQLLSFNPHHLLKPYVSFADALRSPDIQSYLEDLRSAHPPELVERQLQQTDADVEAAPAVAKKIVLPTPRTQAPGEGARTFPLKPPAEESPPAPPPPPPPVRISPTVTKSPAASGPAKGKTTSPDRARPYSAPTSRAAASHAAAEDSGPAGRWFTSLLFVLLLLSGLALAAYTLLGPFLPPDWLPG